MYEPFRRIAPERLDDVRRIGKVTPVENIYLLLQNSRHTYAADYHYHTAICSLVSALRRRCDRVRSEIGRCSAVSELRESDCMFTTTFDSNWLKTDIGSVQGGLSAELSRLLLRAAASGRASDKAIICQHGTATHMCIRCRSTATMVQ